MGLRVGRVERVGIGRVGCGGIALVGGVVWVVGVGIFEGLDEFGIELSESTGDGGEQGFITEGAGEFVFGHGESLRQDLSEIAEGVSRFGVDLAAGDGAEETTEAAVEGAGADIVGADTRRDVVPGVLGSEALELSLGVEETKVGIFGVTGSFAAAAIGESEGTQGGAVLGGFLGHRDLLMKDWNFDIGETREGRTAGHTLPRGKVWQKIIRVSRE